MRCFDRPRSQGWRSVALSTCVLGSRPSFGEQGVSRWPAALLGIGLWVVGFLGIATDLARAQALPALGPPPEDVVRDWKLAPFYQKYASAGGFPVIGSAKVQDAALREAVYLIDKMLAGREDIRRALIQNRVRFVVMAHDELTTHVPEHSDLTPARYWDRRARGLGATTARPAVSCGEENLITLPGDPYAAENILIHEFAHAIHGMGLNTVDPTFDLRLRQVYSMSLNDGLWNGTYAASNHSEFWAEGVQSWFDTNRQNDREHNSIDTREELKKYDPRFAKLIAEVFGDGPWRFQKPAAREPAERAHWGGFDPAQGPRFAWPRAVEEAYAEDQREKAAKLEKRQRLSLSPVPPAGPPASGGAQRATSITFLNRLPTPVTIVWIDFEGAQKKYAVLPTQGSLEQSTYSGHIWLVTDNRERPLGYYRAADEPGQVILE